ncbi:MAG TPA: histidinol phosphate phosphatase domain-containing protein [Dehalococcoidia bacterium]|nr:histidinol phosphate phosphatase domain-containing protein [Dehalococcoidia bacterium]
MIYDFHTHTSLSDGVLSPIELIRRAHAQGYQAIALTDHSAPGTMERIIREVTGDCALARKHWGIMAIPGIELTHVPPPAIAETSRRARELGAWIVVVHGESIIEPVEPGTNLAALNCPEVDILAHPGLLTWEQAQRAARNGIFLELTSRPGHCLTNGLIALLAQRSGAKLLFNSDSHHPSELLTPQLAEASILGTGLSIEDSQQILVANAQMLLKRVKKYP